MATSLSGVMQLLAKWTHSKTVAGSIPTVNQGSWTKKMAYDNGVAAEQCDELYQAVRTLTFGTGSETLDLSGTALQNMLGDNIAFARIKAMAVWLLGPEDVGPDGTAGNACTSITVGAAASNPFVMNLTGTTPKFTVLNGGWHAWAVPDATAYAVTSASNDNLKILNNDVDTDAIYVLSIWGAKT